MGTWCHRLLDSIVHKMRLYGYILIIVYNVIYVYASKR